MAAKPARLDDRRESVRVRKDLSVQYKKGRYISRLRWLDTAIRDISETGLCIKTCAKFEKSDHVRLRIRLPIERPWLRITGRAVKSEPAGKTRYWTHVRLSRLDARQKKQIRSYIAWVLVKEGGTL